MPVTAVNTVRFVPVEKRSKSAQRDYYAQMRNGWNGVNPVSRVVPNKKHYDRKRDKAALRAMA